MRRPIPRYLAGSLGSGDKSKREEKLAALLVALSLAIIALFPWMAMAEEVLKITKEEIKGMLDNADLIIIDVRTEESWSGSPSLITHSDFRRSLQEGFLIYRSFPYGMP